MPVYTNIDRLQQTVTMVAHGTVSNQEIRDVTQELIEAAVPEYGKIIDTSAAISSLSKEQVDAIAEMLRQGPGYERRGPVAYVVNADRIGFAQRFAEASSADRPLRLFTSLRAAREWISETLQQRTR